MTGRARRDAVRQVLAALDRCDRWRAGLPRRRRRAHGLDSKGHERLPEPIQPMVRHLVPHRGPRAEKSDHRGEILVAQVAVLHQRERRTPISADAVSQHACELRVGACPDARGAIRRQVGRVELTERQAEHVIAGQRQHRARVERRPLTLRDVTVGACGRTVHEVCPRAIVAGSVVAEMRGNGRSNARVQRSSVAVTAVATVNAASMPLPARTRVRVRRISPPRQHPRSIARRAKNMARGDEALSGCPS